MYNPETDTFELDPDKPLFLLIGSVAQEGIVSRLQTSGRQYQHKKFASNPDNWETISEFFNQFKISGCIVRIDHDVIWRLRREDYLAAATELFSKISRVPNLILAHESIIEGRLPDSDFRRRGVTQQALDLSLAFLRQFDLEIMPFRRIAQITVLADSFLKDTEQNLLFRVYIPRAKLLAAESEKLLQLFRDYLSTTSKTPVRLDQQSTNDGVIYEFHGDEARGEDGLDGEYADFIQFMDNCLNDTPAAEAALLAKAINPEHTGEVLRKYSKEARRLAIDLKHEFERKRLTIFQHLESQLLEDLPNESDWNLVSEYVDQSLIQAGASLVPHQTSIRQTKAALLSKVIQINFSPSIGNTITTVIAEEISGTKNLGASAKELFELTNELGGANREKLSSAVLELEDESVPKAQKLKAGQRLKGFLANLGHAGKEVATGVLQSYIESKLGL